MRSEAPALLPIFRSRHQADLLTILLLHPDQDHTASDLATRLGVPLTTVHRETKRLVEAGLLTARTVGRARLLRANPANRVVEPLARLLTVTFGPHTVLADEFAVIDSVDLVLIYGSWAARYHGKPGPPQTISTCSWSGGRIARRYTRRPTGPSGDWVCRSIPRYARLLDGPTPATRSLN
jgi:DNA-binding transcriptional ArsR family regulator